MKYWYLTQGEILISYPGRILLLGCAWGRGHFGCQHQLVVSRDQGASLRHHQINKASNYGHWTMIFVFWTNDYTYWNYQREHFSGPSWRAEHYSDQWVWLGGTVKPQWNYCTYYVGWICRSSMYNKKSFVQSPKIEKLLSKYLGQSCLKIIWISVLLCVLTARNLE